MSSKPVNNGERIRGIAHTRGMVLVRMRGTGVSAPAVESLLRKLGEAGVEVRQFSQSVLPDEAGGLVLAVPESDAKQAAELCESAARDSGARVEVIPDVGLVSVVGGALLSTVTTTSEVFYGDQEAAPIGMDYFVWAITNGARTVVVDLGFTARMEEELDEIAEGARAWTEVIRDFYGPFVQDLRKAELLMPEVKAEPELLDRACPRCGKPLVIRHGRYGKFIGCSDFPQCRHTEPWLEHIGVRCPKDGGELVERKTRKGRVFYGCANYPACEFTSWKRPLPQPCPQCGSLLVVDNRDHAVCTVCGNRVRQEDLPAAEPDAA